ncbi:MAG: hypothetical protein AMJ78_05610 [Omnitrophica WOR_2 bacterium SM23_29]|nr:MAG: hypothetical protein AMJ78_05610 [Omnitrophica WOR_2 bacterium SM23_29]
MAASENPTYHLSRDGEFIIKDYNSAKTFASFFPGIAGPHGIPMWVFYVNRGQCICSVGIDDKEHPIMEFLSANRAYQLVTTQGFRTFIKLFQGKKVNFYEPFQQHMSDVKMKRTQQMIIRPASLTLEEENKSLGLKFAVDYFNVPEDNYAGLVRILSIYNLGRKPIRLEGLDGLPLIIPYGVDNRNLKNMRRLVESFVEVTNYRYRVPYFKCKVKQEDRPEVIKVKEGNFYIGFESGERRCKLSAPVVDPECIFGNLTDYSYPARFLATTPYKIQGKQNLENRLPCAMGVFAATIPAGGVYTYASIIGHISTEEELNRLLPSITSKSYIEKKRRENKELIDTLTQNNFVHSSSQAFDLYCRQNFLDNVLRGGFPVTLTGNGKRTTLYLYSRKHGDLERDYNDYCLSPTNYSQGNGNFRDVNQNRRNDIFFNPDVQESNLEHFYNLIQLDGFNPLVVKATSFSIKDQEALDRILEKSFLAEEVQAVKTFLQKRFTPGELLTYLTAKRIKLKTNTDIFLGELLAICEKHQETDYGHGYWSDHWTYNQDLLESYLSLYPEKLRYILFEKKSFTFFDNPYGVLPRCDKYVVWEGNPMQLNAVALDREKEVLIKQRSGSPYEVRTQFGKGEIYRTTLVNKMLSLITNKLASLDPEGVGIEMEADKPNWYDALNGLPGLLGSSISETLELKRLVVFLLQSFKDPGLGDDEHWSICKEILLFMTALYNLLESYFKNKSPERFFEFWNQATTAKEHYRKSTRLGVSGEEGTVKVAELKKFLNLVLRKLGEGIEKAWDKKRRIPYTYFVNKVVDYKEIVMVGINGGKRVKCSARGLHCFRPQKFQQIPLPLFLEGPTHYLRISRDRQEVRQLVEGIKRSGLYDRKLKMYKVNEPLTGQPMEIGRTKIFSPGWFENESIWLHMEYKYLLELLRSGLYAEFYQDFKSVLIPFLKPSIYGRSILENSSFIVSSANPNPLIHGNGFVARLSGSTAEFIHILLLMTVGEKPFTLNEQGELQLQFKPILPGWLFTQKKQKIALFTGKRWQDYEFQKDTFSFNFLGTILVTYYNPRRRNTFGPSAISPQSIRVTDLDGKNASVEGKAIVGELARRIRDRRVSRIDIQLGQ